MDARAGFLSSAAHEYFNTIPTVASSLMIQSSVLSQRNALRLPIAKTHTREQNVCLACGAIMKHGWNCRSSIMDPSSKTLGPRRSKVSKATKYIQHECLHCHRYTRHSIVTQERTSRNTEPAEMPTTSESTPASAQEAKPKKEPRSRRKQGFQSLMERAKAVPVRTHSDYGINIMDMMKRV